MSKASFRIKIRLLLQFLTFNEFESHELEINKTVSLKNITSILTLGLSLTFILKLMSSASFRGHAWSSKFDLIQHKLFQHDVLAIVSK